MHESDPLIRPQTEINISLASQLTEVVTSPRFPVNPRLPFYTAGFFVDQGRAAGYDGMEWHSLRNTTLAGLQANIGLFLPNSAKDYIHSAHQSFRSEKSLREALNHPNPKVAIGAYGLFPEANSSLREIEDLQGKIGRKLPVVVYPYTPAGRQNWDFREKTYQPNTDVLEEFGASSIDEMIERGKEKGFSAVTVDIHHMLTLGPWQEVLPQLLPVASEIHISVGRIDALEEDPNTEQKLEDLYFGRRGTEIYQMLEAIKNSRWSGIVVTEIPAEALKRLRENNPDLVSTSNFVEDNRRIVDNLKEALL
jgi:hypothetical protein